MGSFKFYRPLLWFNCLDTILIRGLFILTLEFYLIIFLILLLQLINNRKFHNIPRGVK